MPKKYEQPPEETPGDFVKNKVDGAMASGMRSTWQRVREMGAGSFIKGALLTGVAVIGVMLLVAGYMGAGSTLQVGGSLMTTFEAGAGAGIDKALQFLTSGLGLATMAAGGAAAVAGDIIQNQKVQAGLESERLALEFERTRQDAKERSKTKDTSTATKENQQQPPTQQAAPTPPTAKKGHGVLDENGFYVEGSVIKNDKFCAAEIKRRTERENRIDNLTV